MKTIRTGRLRLEPVTTRNARALWDVLQMPGLRDFQDLPDVDYSQFVNGVAMRPAILEPGATGRFEWLVAFDRPQSDTLGWVSLRIADRSRATGEVGYSVIVPYRGRGIATEALRGLVDEAFTQAELLRVRAYCVPANAASRSVLRRVGFEEDGLLPHGATVQGQPVDVLGHGLERERWESLLSAHRSASGS